ncbi:hypothetical protein EVAR_26973_1 [Eumeta japonica]|uniref:Uncharacterized protein n=1 Tax=Eumeta variegata TaxID=151549 RepID=A0A4C1VLK7_EUMVA|nr:hypothetical protein EVAR_26973_1 [Eumeta japonica]
MRPIPGHSYRPLIAYDTPSRPRHLDESCCVRKITPDSRLQITHQDKTSNLKMLHTLPPDLRCTGLVCPLLRNAASMSSGPAEHSVPHDCGGRVIRQKQHDRQRLETRNL